MQTIRIMLAGVGGQGTILAAKIISEAASEYGCCVKMSEIHGMSQRGGSVVSHVSIGTHINSPVIGIGFADYLIAFEEMEAARQLKYLKNDGLLIVNDLKINPMPVLTGTVDYPENIIKSIQDAGIAALILNAFEKAAELGAMQVQNVILVGVLAAQTGLENFPWEATIQRLVKPQFVEINLKAFAAGKLIAAEKAFPADLDLDLDMAKK
ncbi:MAG: indolepyruvate oxidoreductase subunit beta [Bacteroidetes bacterium]|nr:indolepyruvate oxidoreductase subunit beta [Bacteroidota bacterium]